MNDFHIHTTFSDGKDSIETIINTAETLNMETLAFTDHIRKNSDWFVTYRDTIKKFQKDTSIKLLCGYEAKALSLQGNLDVTEKVSKLAELRIGAVHRIPSSESDNKFLTKEEIISDRQRAYTNWFITTINMIKKPQVDIIAHPFMILGKYSLNFELTDIIKICEFASIYKKKMEITFRYQNSNTILLKIIDLYPVFSNILVFGSDAHSSDELILAHKRCMNFGAPRLRAPDTQK